MRNRLSNGYFLSLKPFSFLSKPSAQELSQKRRMAAPIFTSRKPALNGRWLVLYIALRVAKPSSKQRSFDEGRIVISRLVGESRGHNGFFSTKEDLDHWFLRSTVKIRWDMGRILEKGEGGPVKQGWRLSALMSWWHQHTTWSLLIRRKLAVCRGCQCVACMGMS